MGVVGGCLIWWFVSCRRIIVGDGLSFKIIDDLGGAGFRCGSCSVGVSVWRFGYDWFLSPVCSGG